MGAYQYFLDRRADCLQEAEEKQKRFEDALRNLGVSEDKIQNARGLSHSSCNEH